LQQASMSSFFDDDRAHTARDHGERWPPPQMPVINQARSGMSWRAPERGLGRTRSSGGVPRFGQEVPCNQRRHGVCYPCRRESRLTAPGAGKGGKKEKEKKKWGTAPRSLRDLASSSKLLRFSNGEKSSCIDSTYIHVLAVLVACAAVVMRQVGSLTTPQTPFEATADLMPALTRVCEPENRTAPPTAPEKRAATRGPDFLGERFAADIRTLCAGRKVFGDGHEALAARG